MIESTLPHLQKHDANGYIIRWRRNAMGFLVESYQRMDPRRLTPSELGALNAEIDKLLDDEAKVLVIEAANGAQVEPPAPLTTYMRRKLRTTAEADPEIMALVELRATQWPVDPDTGAFVIPPDEVPPDPLAHVPPYEPPPDKISDRQFFHQLARPPYELISPTEALAAVKTGEIPVQIVGLIDQAETFGLLPEGMTRFDVEMLVSGAIEFHRLHPTTELLMALWGWTPEERDHFFRDAASLQ